MASTEKKYTDLYLSSLDMLNEGMPRFVAHARREAVEALNLYGIPDKTQEYYRNTPLDEIYDREYEHYFTPSGGVGGMKRLPVNGYEMDIANGFFVGEERMNMLPGGIRCGSLAAAMAEYPELIEPYFNTLAGARQDGAVALNTALMQDGAFVYVPEGIICDKPSVVNNTVASEGEEVSLFCRNLFIFETRAQATIIVNNTNVSLVGNLINVVNESFVGEHAHARIVSLQHGGERDAIISSDFVSQKADSKCKTVTVTLSGGTVRCDFNADLVGAHAENHVYGLYFASAGQHTDNYTHIRHLVPDCSSDEHFKGVVAADGVAVFNGRIFVERDAQRTSAMQQNNNLLLGEGARVVSKPHLEIYADDVKCSHGSTVGQLDQTAVFYMRQRGLSEELARGLQIKGFVCDVISKIDDEGLAEFLDDIAESKIGSLNSL